MKTFFARATFVLLAILILFPFGILGVLSRWIVGSFATGWDEGEDFLDYLARKANGY